MAESAGPAHVAIARQLRAELAERAPGDLLPGDRELAERFGVSRMTVRQAVATLVSEGHVHRVRGSGTYVAERPVHRRMGRLLSFSEHMHRQGRTPSALVVDRGRRPGTRAENSDLEQLVDDEVLTMCRVLRGDGVPIAVEDVALPLRCGDVFDADLSGSLHAALAAGGHRPHRARGTLTAEPAAPEHAKLLDVAIGSALVVQRLLLFDEHDVPVQLVTVRHLGDRIVFDIDQHRPSAEVLAGTAIEPGYTVTSLTPPDPLAHA